MIFIICSGRNNKCVSLGEFACMTRQQRFADLKKNTKKTKTNQVKACGSRLHSGPQKTLQVLKEFNFPASRYH